ncbi:hypothetical protein E2C01_101677 [Portunus trituberculatus]|uniref:Uncharacterized protein n=1 Tax=Portunus trituberculatus TaxID=210409 RepID=A0A5B7KMI0_PORTR|nr:hypothetical protein [Portunus trituberculatus]
MTFRKALHVTGAALHHTLDSSLKQIVKLGFSLFEILIKLHFIVWASYGPAKEILRPDKC